MGTRAHARARVLARGPAGGWPYRITTNHRHHFIRRESHIHLSMEDNHDVGETMGAVIRARYEDKVLKPLGELNLKEGDEVEISVLRSATRRIFGIVKCWEGLEEAHEDYETSVH